MKENLWYQLRHGLPDRALERMAEAYRANPDAANILQLGRALLLVEDYHGAWGHFQEAIKNYRWSADSFHLGAGTAKWCLGQPDEAVDEWRRGLECGYSDPARLWVPLVLYFAAVVTPSVYSDTDARKVLIKRADAPMARYWPGPVAQFLLARIDEQDLLAKCAAGNDKERLMQTWSASFYIGVHEYARGNTGRFREAMRSASAFCDDDFDPSSLSFRWKFGRDEFFISRHEARKAGG